MSITIRTALAAACLAIAATPALACPDWSLNGASLSYSSDDLWTPRAHSVIAGGSVNLAGCPMPGIGHVATAPDFTLEFHSNGAGRALEFRVDASCDTVLLVNDASAEWHFNDDSDGTINPRIRLNSASEGIYDIWVGTFDPATCSATLVIETF